MLVVASFTYVTAQINGTETVAARALQIPFEVGVWIGLAGILFCSMLGGMRAVTWTQVAQYIVLIIAYLIPVFWMSNKLGYGLIPHLAQFDAVSRVQELEGLLGGSYISILPGGSDVMLLNDQEILYTQGSTSLLNLMLKFANTN